MRKKLRVKNLKPQRRYGGLGVRRVPAVPGSYLGPAPPPPTVIWGATEYTICITLLYWPNPKFFKSLRIWPLLFEINAVFVIPCLALILTKPTRPWQSLCPSPQHLIQSWKDIPPPSPLGEMRGGGNLDTRVKTFISGFCCRRRQKSWPPSPVWDEQAFR